MHRFSELIEGCVAFTTTRLDQTLQAVLTRLEQSASTVLIKNLQSVSMQYTITAVGMFSVFDAEVQRRYAVNNGFPAVRELLTEQEEFKLLSRFEKFVLAVNVLKHGEGRSYDLLLEMQEDLPFTIKSKGQDFFDEGNCSEIDTLVLADSAFLKKCATLIHEVSDVLDI